MAIEFSEEERQLISQNRKSFNERPNFFNSQTGEEQKISEDFEAFLILQDRAEKQRTLQWIRRTIEIVIDNADRDTLLEEYLTIRKEDTSLRLEELEEESQRFSSFREDLAVNGDRRFDTVAELGFLTSTLQKPIDSLIMQRDAAFHEQNLITILETRLDLEKSDENTKRELDSWQVVISSYDGVSGGVPN